MAEPTSLLRVAHAAAAQQPLCTRSIQTGSGGGIRVREPPEDIPYAVTGLSHIAIAVPDLSSAGEHYRRAYGAEVSQPVVDDINTASNYLSSEVGVGTVGASTPTLGAAGNPILFLHPKDNHGVLIELEQTKQPVPIRTEGPRVVRDSLSSQLTS